MLFNPFSLNDEDLSHPVLDVDSDVELYNDLNKNDILCNSDYLFEDNFNKELLNLI